ncbi:MAG TPA: hypothetical protein PKW35_06955, partial [Nannocystaceae bacterium]|nr:hypothetical protein [Nannocystaceae bacterium]
MSRHGRREPRRYDEAVDTLGSSARADPSLDLKKVAARFIVDRLKAVVQRADPTEPLINPVFQEYAQERGFVIDPARPRRPQDKARVERSVRDVRDDCFAG